MKTPTLILLGITYLSIAYPAFAESTATTLRCQTMASFKKEGRVTVLPIKRYERQIRDREAGFFPYAIEGTDFSFTVDVGFTANPDLDDESGTYVGKRTLKGLVAYNSSRSQMARFDVPPLEVLRHINLTLGGNQPPNDDWRIHIYCGIN